MTNSSTRVFKKSSANNKITTYLGKRDFIDYEDFTEPVDGVVLIDQDYITEIPGRKVLVSCSCTFRYGREDLDVLGLTFRRDLYSMTQQIYPPPNETTSEEINIISEEQNINNVQGADSTQTQVIAQKNQNTGNKLKNMDTLTISPSQQPSQLTDLQKRLKRKLGENSYPLYFSIPSHCPCSVTLQPAPGDTGKPCGIDYEVKTWVLDPTELPSKKPVEATSTGLEGILPSTFRPEEQEKKMKKDSKNSYKVSMVRLAIRKIQYASLERGPQPRSVNKQTFLLSDKPICLEVTLDKDVYFHGEKIYVNVQVNNNSAKTVKKMKIAVRQCADICLYGNVTYKCVVAQKEYDDHVGPSQTLCKVYEICPLLEANKDKRGLALDGQLKHEDTNLASSTMEKKGIPKENMGIIVKYKVKVKAIIGGLMGTSKDISTELPFRLMHSRPQSKQVRTQVPKNLQEKPVVEISKEADDLICFDDAQPSQPIDQFDEFAKMRLQNEN